MKGGRPSRILRLIIRQKWLAESILRLGSGYITHLTYTVEQIEPGVLADLRGQNLGAEVTIEIVFGGRLPYLRVARTELHQVNDFDGFIRFDLRLLEVGPFARDGVHPVEGMERYRCYFVPAADTDEE